MVINFTKHKGYSGSPALYMVSSVSCLWSGLHRWNWPLSPARTPELLIGYTSPSGTQHLCALHPNLPSLNEPQLPGPANKDFFAFVCSKCTGWQGGQTWRSGSLQPATLGLDSACPNDLTERLIVAGTWFHWAVQTKGRSFGLHTQNTALNSLQA